MAFIMIPTPRARHRCTSFGNSRMMVGGGTGLFGYELSSVEIYDSSLDSWYYSEDLPEEPYDREHALITWDGNPVWLNHRNSIWKFSEGTWTRLNSRVTDYYWYSDFLLMVPDDFIPYC